MVSAPVIFLDCLSYHAHRGKESFDTHVWMVKTLLGQPEVDERDDLEANQKSDLLFYIIAASFRKMEYRLTKPTISEQYFDCLTKMTAFSFNGPLDEMEASDRENDRPFIAIIPDLAKFAKTKIPELRHAASQPWPIEIYNENTYKEFHLLLCELLIGFKDSLKALKILEGKFKNEPNPDCDKILKALAKVFIYGRCLRTMAISSAIETHLQVISLRLVVDDGKLWKRMPDPTDEEEADFLDFQILKPYSRRKGKPLLPWQSYRDWLRLMIHYFDATKVLTSYVKHYKSDSDRQTGTTDRVHDIPMITVLSLPYPRNEMLPWTTLLRSQRLFPDLPNQPSGEEFINLLTSKFDDTSSNLARFYKSLKDGSLHSGNTLTGVYHCETYIACLLLLLLSHPGVVDDFEGQLNMLHGKEEIEQMKAVLEEFKASNVFKHRWNLADFNDRIAGIPSECPNDAAQCVLTYSTS
jgi:hypothetical protein